MDDFLNRGRSTRARIIWCSQDDVDTLKKEADDWGFSVRLNLQDISALRALSENDCLLVTLLELTRGVDYHAPN